MEIVTLAALFWVVEGEAALELALEPEPESEPEPEPDPDPAGVI